MSPAVLRRLAARRRSDGDSVVFIGYPKTGNTWIRFLLGRYLQLRCESAEMPLFDRIDRSGRGERNCVGPAIRFTHDPLRWDGQVATDLTPENTVEPFDAHQVVVLVRYPLDALVSAWHQAITRDHSFTGDLESFIDDPVHGMEKLLRFYELWHDASRTDVGVVRYEDMRAKPEVSFDLLLARLGIDRDPQLISSAIADTSFDSMRRLEATGQGPKFASSGLDVFGTGNRSNPNAFHVRRGKVGGYRDELSKETYKRLEQEISTRMAAVYNYAQPPEA